MYRLVVSQPSLSNFNDFNVLANEVWKSGILTNNGPKVIQLETQLKDKWNIPHLSLVTNGTIALDIALASIDIPKESEIITTPFTWISSASSISWGNYKPVFADINPDTLNIDPNSIEALITDKTSAILAVHVFSNPCQVEHIQEIANKHNLKVIYDAAHAVGVNYKNQDISQYGDVSTQSYHATKIFNTGEGGSVITNNQHIAERIESLRAFGYNKDREIIMIGTNAKMHEISACIGLANLKLLDNNIKYRKSLTILYKKLLEKSLSKIKFQQINEESYNYSYFPIIFDSESKCLSVYDSLEKIGILTRRYFYPSLNTMNIFNSNSCPISYDISSRILCLPCHEHVTNSDVIEITNQINKIIADI